MTRVFRFADPQTGAPQISKFPEAPPQGDSDLEIRIRHFTEIENFGFLGFVLAHEIGEEKLGDELLDTCINWEHFVASTNDQLIPGFPLKIKDAVFQKKIDVLDEQSEQQVAEINRLSVEKKGKKKDKKHKK